MFAGEKKYGRIILIEDKPEDFYLDGIQITFVRFANMPSKKIVGFQVA